MAITRLTKVSCLKGLSIPPSVPFWGSDSETKISTYKKYTNIWRAWNNISIIFSELKIGYEDFSRVLESKIWNRFRSYSAWLYDTKIFFFLTQKSYFDTKAFFWNDNLWHKTLIWHKNLIFKQKSYFHTKILFWHKNLILAQKSNFPFEHKFNSLKNFVFDRSLFAQKNFNLKLFTVFRLRRNGVRFADNRNPVTFVFSLKREHSWKPMNLQFLSII